MLDLIDKIFIKLGGRKFAFAMVIGASGTAIELFTQRGMTASFAGLMATVYTTFAAANAVITRKQMDTSAASAPAVETPTVDLSSINDAIAKQEAAANDLMAKQGKLVEVVGGLQKQVAAALAAVFPKG